MFQMYTTAFASISSMDLEIVAPFVGLVQSIQKETQKNTQNTNKVSCKKPEGRNPVSYRKPPFCKREGWMPGMNAAKVKNSRRIEAICFSEYFKQFLELYGK